MVVSFILGTRPEVIKLAPVIHEVRRKAHGTQIIFTGQHRELVAPLLEFFQIKPDVELNVMQQAQTLTGLSAKVLQSLDGLCDSEVGDMLLVQGDTTSAFIGAFWAFCRKQRVGHVEAGLRTHDLAAPFPEEGNRQLIGRIANWHFAPTLQSAQALEKEGVSARSIFQVGNTGIDAIHFVLEALATDRALEERWLPKAILEFVSEHKLVLVTAHRRESFGPEFARLCQGILKTANERKDARFVFPVHPNPEVRTVVERWLRGHPRILLCEPLNYVGFVALLKRAHLLLTDSGGIQEEGPSLGKPILVMRSVTERPEGVAAGFSKLVGTNPETLYLEASRCLDSSGFIAGRNPYGDGRAAERIVGILAEHIGMQTGAAQQS